MPFLWRCSLLWWQRRYRVYNVWVLLGLLLVGLKSLVRIILCFFLTWKLDDFQFFLFFLHPLLWELYILNTLILIASLMWKKKTYQRKNYSFLYFRGEVDVVKERYSYVVWMFIFSSMQNWILWKQTEWHVYKYGCLPSRRASQPVPHWPHRVTVEHCNFRKWGEKKKRIKGKW